jgi:hypothetical protein
MPRGKTPKVYDPAMVAEVTRLYANGMTQTEVATALGTTQHVIYRLMANHNIPTRPAAKREQRGTANAYWGGKGDAPLTYAAFHKRVEATRGFPDHCVYDPTHSARYEWANLTGDYANVMDYEPMCATCHRRFDAARRKATGLNTMGLVPRRKGE